MRNRKKSSFYEEKSLAGLTPGVSNLNSLEGRISKKNIPQVAD
jgi:hypothetical protein